MNKKEYEELKKTLAKVKVELARNDLTEKERLAFEHHQAALSGKLMSVWLPISNFRRAIMLIFLLLGLRAFINYDDAYIWYWIAIVFFSPKAIGILTYSFGRIMGRFKKQL